MTSNDKTKKICTSSKYSEQPLRIVVLVHGVMTLSFGLPVFWIFPVPRPFAQDRHIVLRVRHNSKQRWASVEMPVQEVVDRDLT